MHLKGEVLITEFETALLATIQTVYDTSGWFGVAALLIFENTMGIRPSEIILGLAGWMLISERQLPASMVFMGGLYVVYVFLTRHSFRLAPVRIDESKN